MTINPTRLDAQISAILQKHRTPGAAISIVKNGEPVYRHLHGVMSIDDPRPITDAVTFDIGSITKTFNAAAMALMVDEGKISFDDFVINRLPGWRMSDPTVTPHVQISDLLGQSLGLGEDNITNYCSHFSREQIIHQIAALPLRVPFRSECTYQSYGPISAGAIVERLSGMSWEDFIEQRIAAPLGLKETFASFFRMKDRSIACGPHFHAADGSPIAIPHRNFDNLAPAGSMTSSLRDLERWFAIFANHGAWRGKPFIQKKTVERMLRPRTMVQPDGIHPKRYSSRFEGQFISYGLGWYAHDFAGRRINEHTGALEGFFVLGCSVPSENLAVLVLTNQHGSPAVHTLRYVALTAALGLPEQDFESRYEAFLEGFPEEPNILSGEPYYWRPLRRDEGAPRAFAPASLSGRYVNPDFGDLTVRAQGDRLSLDFFGNDCQLDHWHGDLYQVSPRDQVLAYMYKRIYLEFIRDHGSGGPMIEMPSVGRFAKASKYEQ